MTTSIKPVLVDFTGDYVEGSVGMTDWLDFIFACNAVTAEGGALPLFGEPTIVPAGEDPTGVYTEQYPDALVELDGVGDTTARIRSLTDHGSSVMRISAERKGLTIVELDNESSGSRQHFIETGRFLRPGEAEAFSVHAEDDESMSDLDEELQLAVERAVAAGRRIAQTKATTLGMIVERAARALGLEEGR